ncbi:MAG: DUF4166 domain-containing protein [Rhodobacteraceae bacterium]|nr:DUF4166 domain-containing protein [Paracoccaceae bacterium]
MRILLLGGYGVFGGRLVHLISDLLGVEVLVAGRDPEKARRFCKGWMGSASLRPILLDRANVAAAIAGERPDLIIDASGPFQAYGDDPYRVVRAALDAGIDYLDFADGADFVSRISQFDAEAKAKGVFILSGVSSFPVLIAAVLRDMAQHMTIHKVTAGIAPSPHAGVGMNVMRAVLSYAGSPVRLWRNGTETTATGLADNLRYTVAPPGELPLASTRFSLVDVPDLRLIPAAMPGITDIWVGAGPVPEYLHRLLSLLAVLRRIFRLPSLTPLAPLCYKVLNAARFGPHRGGMFIEAEGEVDGQPVRRSWHLLAEGDDGPLIPSMAIEAIVRKLMLTHRPPAGARAAIGDLDLADYQVLFRRRDIRQGWRDSHDAAGKSLYPLLLGDRFARLPAEVQALHQPGARSVWRGRADVIRGTGLLAAVVAGMFRFPKQGKDIPVEVTFTTDAEGRELWVRNFAGRAMRSRQEAGRGRNLHHIIERFGPVAVTLAVLIRGDRLFLVPRGWRIFGLPLPASLLPHGQSFESAAEGRFRFHVDIDMPIIGPVVRYEGWLEPA